MKYSSVITAKMQFLLKTFEKNSKKTVYDVSRDFRKQILCSTKGKVKIAANLSSQKHP